MPTGIETEAYPPPVPPPARVALEVQRREARRRPARRWQHDRGRRAGRARCGAQRDGRVGGIGRRPEHGDTERDERDGETGRPATGVVDLHGLPPGASDGNRSRTSNRPRCFRPVRRRDDRGFTDGGRGASRGVGTGHASVITAIELPLDFPASAGPDSTNPQDSASSDRVPTSRAWLPDVIPELSAGRVRPRAGRRSVPQTAQPEPGIDGSPRGADPARAPSTPRSPMTVATSPGSAASARACSRRSRSSRPSSSA